MRGEGSADGWYSLQVRRILHYTLFDHIAVGVSVVLCDKCITEWGKSIRQKKENRTQYTTFDV